MSARLYRGIAFVGTMNSGKTTASKVFQTAFDAVPLSFATRLKELAQTLYDMKEKDRRLLQALGAAMRMIDNDVFVRCLGRELDSVEKTHPWRFPVVDDVRHENEFDFLRARGFYMVHISRTPPGEGLEHQHESEAGVRYLAPLCDAHLDNTAPVDDELWGWARSFSRQHMSLEHRLGYSFHNPALLEKALTHGSSQGHDGVTMGSLETLGDSVLGLVVTHTLFCRETTLTCGKLTTDRAAIVNNRHLATRAEALGLHQHVRASDAVKQDHGAMTRIGADVLEAIIGAIWADCGDIDKLREIVGRIVLSGL